MYGMLVLLYISHVRTKLKDIEHLQIAHSSFWQALLGWCWEQAPPRKIVGSSINLNLVLQVYFLGKFSLKYSFDSLLYRTSNRWKQLNFAISISGRRYWVPVNLCYLQKLEIYCSLILRVHVKFCFNWKHKVHHTIILRHNMNRKNNIKRIQTSKATVKRTYCKRQQWL